MTNFTALPQKAQQIIDRTINLEGHYSNNPYDPGGKTCWGITEATARANGYTGVMSQMPIGVAKDIYANRFWSQNGLEKVSEFSWLVAEEIFDTSVNTGQSRGWKLVQQILNAMNTGEWEIVAEDGRYSNTIPELKKAVELKGETKIYNYINGAQYTFYLHLTEQDAKFRKFFNGWINARVRWV